MVEKMVICCCSDYGLVNDEVAGKIFSAALGAGVSVEICPDLCREGAENPDFLRRISEEGTVVAACFPRAVRTLFSRVERDPPQVVDIRGGSVGDILSTFGWEATETVPMEKPAYVHQWKAWYPLIDPERCTHCGKCVDFCFFGVYQRNEGKIQVKFPKNCKNNCPACARMCPSKAIIFPKHTDTPINGGEGGVSGETGLLSSEQIFDEHLYSRLAQRRRAERKNNLLKE